MPGVPWEVAEATDEIIAPVAPLEYMNVAWGGGRGRHNIGDAESKPDQRGWGCSRVGRVRAYHA